MEDPAPRTWLVRLRGGVRAGRGGRLCLGQGRALHQPLAVEDTQLRLEPRPRHLAALGQLACNGRRVTTTHNFKLNTEAPRVTSPPLTERPGGSPACAVSVLPRSVPADARPRPAPPPAPPCGSGPLVQVGPRPELGSAHQDGVGPEHECFTYSLATIYCLQCYLTGALASDGVVEGAVEEAGVRMVLLGATPCRAHRILCLCPGCSHE